MAIDPNKAYRTRNGRPVRIYAVDGARPRPVHGAWESASGWLHESWRIDGKRYGDWQEWCDLIEVTLADKLTEQIPWEVLRPEIQWVALIVDDGPEGLEPVEWLGFIEKPRFWRAGFKHQGVYTLEAIKMPEVDPARWRETLCKRPEGR